MLESASAAMEGDIGVDGEVDIDISMTATWVIDTVQFEEPQRWWTKELARTLLFLMFKV